MNKASKIRSIYVMLVFFALYAVIVFNLLLIQVKQAAFFSTLGDKQYTIVTTQMPIRAPIFDRNGSVLATHKECFAAFVLPRSIKNVAGVESFLAHHFPDALKRLSNQREKHFMYIKRRLTQDDVDLINTCELEDIKLLKEPNRFYPLEAASPVVGITNIDNRGLCGIELVHDALLAGSPTTITLKKDARSRYFSIEQKTDVAGTQGVPIILTIDSMLQFLVHEHLSEAVEQWRAQDGGAVIMDPTNGDVLAMVNVPSFDPNNTNNLEIETTKNRCVADVYEFGSVMKVFAALAALEQELVTLDEMIDCENTKSTIINGMRVNTWFPHGMLSFSEVLQRSNNIGIAKVTSRLDKNLYDHYVRLGFGKKTNINLPGEQNGFITPPHAWSKQSIFSLSYGYEISLTLLQLARAWTVIANEGYLVQPRIVLEKLINPSASVCPLPLYRKKSIEMIRSICEQTVVRGTARKTRLDGYMVMGKTGTANLLVNGAYDRTRDIYSFGGIVEKGNYKRVIVVYVKNVPNNKNLFAAQVVVPLFKKIAESLIIHDKVL